MAGNLLGDPTTREFYVLLPSSYATSDKNAIPDTCSTGNMGYAKAPVGRLQISIPNCPVRGRLAGDDLRFS